MSYPPTLHKTYTAGETLTASDLNSSLQDIQDAAIPEDIDDFSVNTAEMQTTADPYPAASPSLATSLSEEIARIRYILKQITGKSQWYIDCAAIGSKGADVASGAALTLGTDGDFFDITGTTTITSIGTLGVGSKITLQFDGALTLTHHATDLVLPGGKSIITMAGDVAEFREYASGDWILTNYTRNKAELQKGADIASAATLTLGNDGDFFDVTGTTTITAISERYIGAQVTLQFDGALTLTHHATDLILPDGRNIRTAAGDIAVFRQYAAGDWHLVSYNRGAQGDRRVHAWARVAQTGGAFSLLDSENVSGLTDDGVGLYTLTFSVAAAGNVAATAIMEHNGTFGLIAINSNTASALQMRITDTADNLGDKNTISDVIVCQAGA